LAVEFLFPDRYDLNVTVQRLEALMFTCGLILIFILPVAFVPLAIADLKAHDQLTEMGIRLKN
jgi:hypothetical protein